MAENIKVSMDSTAVINDVSSESQQQNSVLKSSYSSISSVMTPTTATATSKTNTTAAAAAATPVNSTMMLSNETRGSMGDAKSSAAVLTKHIADAAAAYDSGCKGPNNTYSHSKKFIPAIEASELVMADCKMISEGATRHCVGGPEARRVRAHLERHSKEIIPIQIAAIKRCTDMLELALERSTKSAPK